MFKTASPEDIGKHLEALILAKYENRKEFCQAYLEFLGNENDDTQGTEDRFCKIVSGNRSIQTNDLLVIAELLGVSCEEILTAGKLRKPSCFRVTNRDIASSKDPKIWKRYMKQKTFLNKDEYSKTVIDYAFEAKNILFLKYLIESGFIQVITPKKGECYCSRETFEIQTVINNKDYYSWEDSVKLRTRLVLLAIETGNIDVLDLMHARELYIFNCQLKNYKYDFRACEQSEAYSEPFAEAIALSDNKAVLDYFSAEYSIRVDESSHETEKGEEANDEEYDTEQEVKFTVENLIICPFISAIIEKMMDNERYHQAEKYLQSAIEHNQKVYGIITDCLNSEVTVRLEQIRQQKEEERNWCYSNGISFEKYGRYFQSENEIRRCTYEEMLGHRIGERITVCYDSKKRKFMMYNLTTMIIENPKIPSGFMNLINALNEWHNKIIELKKEWKY
ncbi:MAG: hypothetical protein IJL67_14110 [Oscillospiraceae bacterium]|nr:hypothetical protein [Oscillospiraceae bacterium]